MSKDIFRIGDRVVITDFPYDSDVDVFDYNGRTGTVITLPPDYSDNIDFWYEVMIDDLESDEDGHINPILVDPLEMKRA